MLIPHSDDNEGQATMFETVNQLGRTAEGLADRLPSPPVSHAQWRISQCTLDRLWKDQEICQVSVLEEVLLMAWMNSGEGDTL